MTTQAKRKGTANAKLRAVRVTDPDKIAAAVARGKYREHMPHYEKQPDGSILLEVKDVDRPH